MSNELQGSDASLPQAATDGDRAMVRQRNADVEEQRQRERLNEMDNELDQAIGIRAAAEAPRNAEADTDNDESDLENDIAVGVPPATRPRRARPRTWLKLKSEPKSILDIEFDITDEYFQIGRVLAANQIVIPAKYVSKSHCTFEKIGINPLEIALYDVSRNGIRVNSMLVGNDCWVELRHEDTIEFFRDDAGGSLTMTVDMENLE